jgi:diguanylate cyclase (GGDEF)-like protein
MSPWRKRGRRTPPDGDGDATLHDPLTTLPGRLLFSDRLERALARSVRRRSTCAVLSLDLGGATDDELLIEAGARLDACLRPEDSVARTDGARFLVLLETVHDTAEAVAVAERIGAALRESHLTASIGIALGREDPDALIAGADAAVYRAKAAGRGRVEVACS